MRQNAEEYAGEGQMKLKYIIQAFSTDYIKSEYYQKVLRSFLLTSCLIIMMFSLLLFLSSNREYDTMLESIQEQTIQQAQFVNQTTLRDIVSYCYRLMEDTSMGTILYGDSLDMPLQIEAIANNKDLRRSSSLIHSSYFINFRTGTVIDDDVGRVNIENHQDKEIFEILNEMSPSYAPMFCYPRVIPSRRAASFYYDVPILSIIFYSNASGAMVVNLDYDLYRQLFSLDDGDHINMLMLNSWGHVIAASDSELFSRDLSQDNLYLTISDKPRNRGTFPFNADGVNYSVCYIKGEGMGITYICSRKNQLIYPDNRILLPLLRFTAIYIFVGFILSLLLSRILYDPLKQLKHSIASSRPGNTSLSNNPNTPSPYQDFDYLSHVYREIVEMNTQLLQDRYTHQNIELFAYLLGGTMSGPASKYTSELEALDAYFPGKNYAILVLGVDLPPAGNDPAMEIGMLKYAIQNVSLELLSAMSTTHPIMIESPFIIFLLNYDTMDTENLFQTVRSAQDFIADHFHTTFSAGLGDAVQDLNDLSQSYDNAVEAFSQKFISGYGSFHTAEELRLTPADAQTYPYEIAEALLEAIKSLSTANALRLTQEFMNLVKTYDIEQILSFTLQLHFSLQKLEHANYIRTTWDWSYKSLEKSTLHEIKEQMSQRCLFDIEQLTAIRSISSETSGRAELVDQVRTLVEDNIYNSELSVTFLADQVHLSVNYLRNIFKDSTGTSLSNYINSRKIDVICRLLVESDLTLTEINDKLGFSTRNYFYAFFKKHVGMTPGDYRKQKKHIEQ